MSTLIPMTGGFEATGACSVVANLLLSPANGPSSVIGRFPKAAASGINAVSGLLVFNYPDGTQESLGLAVSTPTIQPIPFPELLFTGRSGSWSVVDQGPWRTVTINVASTDGTGVNDSWTLDFTVCVPGGGTSNFFVLSGTPQATVSSVEVTPAP